MKRLAGILLTIVVLYAIFNDLTKGSLPGSPVEENATQETVTSLQYIEASVKPGDTLLSLIESQGHFPENISIEQMVEDFVLLNDGIFPEQMRPGEMYKIPVYEQGSLE